MKIALSTYKRILFCHACDQAELCYEYSWSYKYKRLHWKVSVINSQIMYLCPNHVALENDEYTSQYGHTYKVWRDALHYWH